MSRPSHMTDCEGEGAGVIANGATMCRMCGRWFLGEIVPAHWRLDILAVAQHPTRAVLHEHWMTEEDQDAASLIAARRRAARKDS